MIVVFIFRGERNDMPAPCEVNLCFNSGTCRIISEITFECFCEDGFSGDFCDFKAGQDHLSVINPSASKQSLSVVTKDFTDRYISKTSTQALNIT